VGISDLIRRRAAAELHPRWAAALPSLERYGLQGFVNPEDGRVPMDTGHRLFLAASDAHPNWDLHITHRDDGEMPARKVIAHLGPGEHDVGDRVMRALRHPEVMDGMRRLMQPPEEGEWWAHDVTP
jgi:hypothetical protein